MTMDVTKVVASFVFIGTVGLVIFLPKVSQYFLQKYRLRNFKGPRGLPILGNVLQFGRDSVEFTKFIRLNAVTFRENGSFLVYFGLYPVVVVYNAVDMEKILRNIKHDGKGYFYKTCVSPWLGNGLLLSEGSKWATRRKLLTPSFHFSILKKFLTVFNEQAQCLTEKISQLADKSSVNFPPLISLCSLDIMSETIMGLRLAAQEGGSSEYVEAVHRMSTIIVERARKPWCWNNFIFCRTQLGKAHEKYLRILHNTTKQGRNPSQSE
ncbi:Cytochrome P450 4V2 [Holothuria leucospilota]|uniref:Cytochrome P450 4V2 n=1 Tax=Holothuria leucospilota TaxID=206669 RepID=A0A9Q1BIE2_HOLLE|nr:Cytochrome P450 4V2 [Holothuria leucospilota]